jgi:hypothetical protein
MAPPNRDLNTTVKYFIVVVYGFINGNDMCSTLSGVNRSKDWSLG